MGVGFAGGLASIDASAFYAQLVKPSWAPPAWLFGPAWTVLYVLMGTAAWLVWRERALRDPARRRARRHGLAIYVVHLLVNALWTWIFFRWRAGGAAFAELVVLWVFIAITAVLFHRVRPLAAWLLVPYLAWVTYAGALNWAVWRANPGLL